MKIAISSGDELNHLLDALGQEIVEAQIYHRLLCDLVAAIPEYKREFKESNTFWHVTINSLKEARLIRLCRVFDQNSSSLNLVNLLEIIKENLHLFTEEQLRERIKDNVFADSLCHFYRPPNKSQLETDIEYASCRNLLIKKLMIWRNNIVAHRGIKVVLSQQNILHRNPLSNEEIENLLTTGLRIFNRYSSLYRASSNSGQIIGHNDYKYLLDFIRLGLQKWDEDIDKEFGADQKV
ncbi:MAG: hypothetical protein AAFU71_02310 [Cyanobacteria bacterium J06632_22]